MKRPGSKNGGGIGRRGLLATIKAMINAAISNERKNGDVKKEKLSPAVQRIQIPEIAPRLDERLIQLAVEKINRTHEKDRLKRDREMFKTSHTGAPGIERSAPERKGRSSIGQNWAKGILGDKNIPENVKAAARGVLAGTIDEETARNVFREYEGVKRSGAGEARRAFKPIRQLVSSLSKAKLLTTAIGQGGPGTAFAAAELFNLGVQEVGRIKDKRSIQGQLFQAASQALGNDRGTTRTIANKLGRGARMFGAVADAWAIGSTIGETLYNPTAERLQGVGQVRHAGHAGDVFDIGRQNELEASMAAKEAGKVRGNRRLEVGSFKSDLESKNIFGMQEEKDQDIARRLAERGELYTRARKVSKELGIDEPDALQKYASSVGKPVYELTEREKAFALNRAIEPIIDPANFGNSRHVNAKLANQSPLDRAIDFFWRSESQMSGKRNRFGIEIAKQMLRGAEIRAAEVEENAYQVNRSLFQSVDNAQLGLKEFGFFQGDQFGLKARAEVNPAVIRQQFNIDIQKFSTEFEAKRHRNSVVELD